MADDDGQEKKHDPSAQGWQDAAEKGQFPRSADLGSVAVILTGTAALTLGGAWMADAVVAVFEIAWEPRAQGFTQEDAVGLFQAALYYTAMAAMIPLSAILVAGVIANLSQTGGQLATKALEPDLSRLNPITGFQNHYMSWTPLVELAKGLLKLTVLAGVAWWVSAGDVEVIPTLALTEPADLLGFMVSRAGTLVLFAAPLLLVIAAGDYAYSYYRQFEQLKRTDQQVKDEAKQQDGNPQVRAQRRALARKYATQSLLAAVSEADVLVTNPTHYAVALRYDPERDGAPVVLAKGIDHLALILRTEAMRKGVPRVEDRPLARALYAQVDIGRPIPEDMFMAVARVLAIVLKRKKRKKSR
ncbi:MAG: EscU/YscU/HrcU family type III secretion system export apparatus switch protein [Myxococcota bacterium]